MKINLKPLNEQVVVLLGATSGIGLETALHMADKGAQIVIVGRSQEGLNEALEQVRGQMQMSQSSQQQGNGHSQVSVSGGDINPANTHPGMNTEFTATSLADQVLGLEADVTNFEQVRSVAEQVVQRFGRIDTWVNIAAVAEWALFEDTSPEDFRRIIDVNLIGQANGAMAALPHLKQQGGGALIFVASIDGRIPTPYQSAYNASKHGIMGMADTLRLELKHTGVPVSVTTILPASIDTPLFEKARTKIGVEPNPLPPVYQASMVAKAIAFAASHPVRELIVGDSGYMMTFMRRMAPTLTDNFLGAIGFRAQRSTIPKSAQAPSNLYQHMPGYEDVSGDNPPRTGRFSVLTWFSTHPMARMAVYGLMAAGVGAFIGWRVIEARNERRSWRYKLSRQAKKAYRQMSKQVVKQAGKASKASSKALKNAGEAAVALPIVSNLPMFRKRTFIERVGDFFADWWAAILAIELPFQLPFLRRKNFAQRMADRLPDISMPSMPWQPSTVDKVTMAKQRKAVAGHVANVSSKIVDRASDQGKAVADRLAKTSSKLMDTADDQSKKAAKRFAKATTKMADQAEKQRKTALKQADKIASRAQDAKKVAAKAVAKNAAARKASKDTEGEVVIRKESFIEKLPFGERRETIVERVPVKK